MVSRWNVYGPHPYSIMVGILIHPLSCHLLTNSIVTIHYPLTTLQVSICHYSLKELSNPGASGSLFYRSADDEFIVKTVSKKEAEFLQKLLPGYYLVV